ncbi:hypothetical protein [Chryseobacterium foetidum]|uniref:hypothetical protein n=1 Tax=Chryseobacterium foetidum TaxID=2951057 RepID=UPI0021C6934E|nr:hypothetical protein [Chryseobacterium foetidum]
MSKLWVNNLMGIEFILIPTHFSTKEELEVQQRKMLPPENYFPAFHSKRYIAEESFEQPGKEDLKLSYHVNLKIQEENSISIVETTLSNFLKNQNISDDKVSSLSLECMKSIYPVSLQLAENGTIKSCSDHQHIVKKFKTKRNEIEDFYIGELSTAYLDLFEKNISDEDYFLQKLKSCFLYHILFPNLKWFSKTSSWKERLSIQINSFPLEFTFKTENFYEIPDFVETAVTGIISDPCSLRELLKGFRIEDENPEDFIHAEIQIKYFTDKITKQLDEARTSLNIWHQNDLFQKHTLHLTKLQDEGLPNTTER